MSPSPVAWRAGRWVMWAGLGAAIVWGAVATVWCPSPPVPPASSMADEEQGFDLPVVRNPGYLGPQACAECHAARVAEFKSTRHYQACCVPQSATTRMPAGFAPGKGNFVSRIPGLRFEMTQADGEFAQQTYRTTAAGEQATSSPIAFVYGSGAKTDEVYFTWHDDRLYELPMVWLDPFQEWATSPFDPHGSKDFSRDLTIRCVECHNTWFEHTPGTLNEYSRDNIILGVTCENCHGPGRAHVAFHQAHPDSVAAQAVVRPKHLSRERQMDLCAQCHSNAIKHRGPAFSYRPGEPLDDFYKTLHTAHPEDDHVANQVQYLRQSRCFRESETLTCSTCHDPHRPRSAANAGSVSCLKCHAAVDCADRGRLPLEVQDNCTGCHMPRLNKVQVYFQTATEAYLPPVQRYEHQIAIYPTARQQVLLEWYRTQTDAHSREEAVRLTQALAKQKLADAERFRREYRFLAAIDACREALRFDPSPAASAQLNDLLKTQKEIDTDFSEAVKRMQDRFYPAAIELLEKILTLKPDLAKAHGRLGTAYANLGQQQRAIEHLQAVAQYDRDDPYGYAMLGWLAYLDGRPEEALEQYLRADDVEPYNARINLQMGLALSKLGRWPEAVERFRKVVAIDPRDAAGYHGLGQALRQQGQTDEALRFDLGAARLTRFQDPEILLSLAETYASLGRYADAADTANRGLDAARSKNHRLEGEIRRRRDEFRARDGQRPAALK